MVPCNDALYKLHARIKTYDSLRSGANLARQTKRDWKAAGNDDFMNTRVLPSGLFYSYLIFYNIFCVPNVLFYIVLVHLRKQKNFD